MIKILRAYRDQLRQVVTLLEAYRNFYEQPKNHEAVKEFMKERFARSESVVFLAMNEDEPVGFVQLYPSYDSVTLRKVWILHDLFVLPASRKKGIAKALMERAKRLAEETNAKGLVLETAINNAAAQQLYEKLGWKRETSFHRYFLNV